MHNNVEELSDIEMEEYLAERMLELNLRRKRENVPQENSDVQNSTKEFQTKSKQRKITAFISRKALTFNFSGDFVTKLYDNIQINFS